MILLGKWTEADLERLLGESSRIADTGERIAFLSKQFLDTPYREATLTGSNLTPEILVINLAGVDCFTYLDYIEALRRATSFAEFRENVVKVRYQDGVISYRTRNHFFTDWVEFNADAVDDVTSMVGRQKTENITKYLNEKEDGTLFLPDIPPKKRRLSSISSENIDDKIVEELKTGDYIGIYTPRAGLDVSHVGILIKSGSDIYLRHASSAKEYRKVVDQDFISYIASKPGIIVLRPK
ncbi:MAG: N-acetylmuramoyl-L-alanine amidase-like domain-containing protein [Nitrospirota bacterium]